MLGLGSQLGFGLVSIIVPSSIELMAGVAGWVRVGVKVRARFRIGVGSGLGLVRVRVGVDACSVLVAGVAGGARESNGADSGRMHE